MENGMCLTTTCTNHMMDNVGTLDRTDCTYQCGLIRCDDQ